MAFHALLFLYLTLERAKGSGKKHNLVVSCGQFHSQLNGCCCGENNLGDIPQFLPSSWPWLL